MSKLNEKALEAAKNYVTHRGYDVIDSAYETELDGQLDIVAMDEGALVFIDVLARKNSKQGFPSEPDNVGNRKRRENQAICWISEHPEYSNNIPVRFDVVSIIVVAEHRAFLRHHINALGMGIQLPEPLLASAAA